MENKGNYDRLQWEEYMVRLNGICREAKWHGYRVSSGQQEGRKDAPFVVIFRRIGTQDMIEKKNDLLPENEIKVIEK